MQWLRSLLEKLGFDLWKSPLYCDSNGCILESDLNLKNPVDSEYTTHVAISFHHARSAKWKARLMSDMLLRKPMYQTPSLSLLFLYYLNNIGKL